MVYFIDKKIHIFSLLLKKQMKYLIEISQFSISDFSIICDLICLRVR